MRKKRKTRSFPLWEDHILITFDDGDGAVHHVSWARNTITKPSLKTEGRVHYITPVCEMAHATRCQWKLSHFYGFDKVDDVPQARDGSVSSSDRLERSSPVSFHQDCSILVNGYRP